MRFTYIIIFSAIVVLVFSAGLIEEFTWTRITYRWPKIGPAKRQVLKDPGRYSSITADSDPRIFFDGETNAAVDENKPSQEAVPKFIDYKYG